MTGPAHSEGRGWAMQLNVGDPSGPREPQMRAHRVEEEYGGGRGMSSDPNDEFDEML